MNPTRTITVLQSFDAMRLFLEDCWRTSSDRPDDLASLLGSLNRDESKGHPPLDAAQWDDWLAAILAVNPDLQILKEISLRRLDNDKEFNRIRSLQHLEVRKEQLEAFQRRHSQQRWDQGGEIALTPLEGFEAMRVFILSHWKHGDKKSKDITVILDTLAADGESERSSNILWNRWLSAVERIQDKMSKV